jgi:hypothetical protein
MDIKPKSNEIRILRIYNASVQNRLGRLDGSPAGGPVVGASRFHDHDAQQGFSGRGDMGLYDARSKRHGFSQQIAVSRN